MTTRMLSALLIAAMAGHATVSVSSPPDQFLEPPDNRSFPSPNRIFEFVVSLGDEEYGHGELVSASPRRTTLWKMKLNQKYGPKFVLTTDSGTVVMLDEWRNVTSPSAIEIRNSRGKLLRRYSTDAVAKATRKPLHDVAAHAKPGLGWWLSGEPKLARDGVTVIAPTAGGYLNIDTRRAGLIFKE